MIDFDVIAWTRILQNKVMHFHFFLYFLDKFGLHPSRSKTIHFDKNSFLVLIFSLFCTESGHWVLAE